MPTLLEFHLQPNTDDSFNVTVFDRNSSQPLASSRFDYRLNDLAQFEISRLDFNPRDPHGRLERLQAFGQKLYQKLFSPELQQLWQQQRDRSDLLTLCLRIHADAKGLEAVPWETLYDGTEFIAAGAKTTITRLPLGIVPTTDLPAIPLPLRMLAFVSSPPDLPDGSRLNIEREQELLLEAVNAPAGQGKLHVDFEDEAKLEILESSLEAGYHILHFTGHGIAPENGGGLLLEDHDGKRLPVGVHEFSSSLAKGFSTLRLAVISGCNTAQTLHTGGFRDLARELVEKKIPAVLAMQFSISDVGGLKLAEVLYPKLIAGNSLEAAVHAARRALWLTDDPFLQADALALVLLTGNGNCLQSKAAEAPTDNFNPRIDTGFQLGTLPQLGFKFYGRRKEYRQLRDALLVNNHRAIIIHGIGGIGKTSLISHAADRLYHRRRQDGPRFKGVYAFDCAGATLAPERVLLELHRYFALQGINALERFVAQPLEPEMLAQIVAQLLTSWPLFLIFDNFETQLARTDEGFRIADEGLRRFLAALVKATATNTKFVFTCRFLFELDGRLGDVVSLPLGDLSRPEAINLMLQVPNLAERNYFDKVKAYEYFGGHPFAIMQLDKYCQDRSLYEALQNAEALHTNLREHLALELSYGQLTEQARELLNRLAAFRVFVSVKAVEWIMIEEYSPTSEQLDAAIVQIREQIERGELTAELKDADDISIAQMLTFKRLPGGINQSIQELIEWSLLALKQENNGSHILVHPLVRDFCCDKQPDTWPDRLCSAATFYTEANPLSSDSQPTQEEIWNQMEAFELLMEAKDFEKADNVLRNVHPLLDNLGAGYHLEYQYSRMLGYVENSKYPAALYNLGILKEQRGDYEGAMDYLLHSLKFFEDSGNIKGVANSLHMIGMLHYQRSDYDEARDYHLRALKLFEELGHTVGIANSLHEHGKLLAVLGHDDPALKIYQRALQKYEEIADKRGIANTLHQIGAVHQRTGNLAAAHRCYMRAIKIDEALGNVRNVAKAQGQIGLIYGELEEYNAALLSYQRALKIDEDIGNTEGVATSLHNIGNVYVASGDHEAALDYYYRALELFEKLNQALHMALSQTQIGRVLIKTQKYEKALNYLLDALENYGDLESPQSAFVVDNLKFLRTEWADFDRVWCEFIEDDIPEWLQ